uniref:Fungal lipase-like domain-containing protein n=1 Tax=Panagrolaimus sp. JU765 TaxID=591449 RepID=A0AC34PZN7_9BILA
YYRHIVVDCNMFTNNITDILCAGGTGVVHDYKAIILSFRGTQGGDQWNQEFDNLNMKVSFPGGGVVSKFYYNAFITVWNGGLKNDFLAAKNSFPGYELWVTGYSLGGAMAAMGATYISQMAYYD